MSRRCRARGCRQSGSFVIQIARKTRVLCKEHAQMVVNGEPVVLKPYRQPGVEPTPRTFVLDRKVDESGISGIGIVAEGVEFTDGTVCLRWLTETQTTVLFDSLQDVKKIHGHGSTTQVRWTEET
jgi:hypothetical protein